MSLDNIKPRPSLTTSDLLVEDSVSDNDTHVLLSNILTELRLLNARIEEGFNTSVRKEDIE